MTQKYQVLARKYRPKNFQEVIGQDTVVTTLKNALRFQKIAQAYLFCGSRGTGKTTLARLLAKALNCSNLSEKQEPCNQCSSCLDIIAGQSLDVIEIDGASNRGIDDMRQINEMVGYIPRAGRYKIYIIDEVHMLTKEAFNALLKTLEEPPPQAKFFFATTEIHKVLPTIISRCQRFDLGRIPQSQIVSKLEQIARDLGRSVHPEALHKISTLSEGSLRDAESLLDQLLCFAEGEITVETIHQVFGLVSEEHFFALDTAFSTARLAYAFELVASLFQAGQDFFHFMSQLIDHYRMIALCKTVGEGAIASPLAARYMQASLLYTEQQSLYLLEYLITAESGLQKSLSPRIFLEATLLHIIRSKNRIPIEVLTRRLLELQGTLPQDKKIAHTPMPSIEPQPIIAPSVTRTIAPTPVPPAQIQETKPKTVQSPIAESAPLPLIEDTPKKPIPPTPKAPRELPDRVATKHPSHYDTLMRFAAVELEGSLKN